jgi:hypothetical protein
MAVDGEVYGRLHVGLELRDGKGGPIGREHLVRRRSQKLEHVVNRKLEHVVHRRSASDGRNAASQDSKLHSGSGFKLAHGLHGIGQRNLLKPTGDVGIHLDLSELAEGGIYTNGAIIR